MSESTRRMISERVRAEWNAGIRGRQEARKEIGLGEELPDDDEYKDDAVEGDDGDPGDAEQAFFSTDDTVAKDTPEGIPDEAFNVDSRDECGGSVVEGDQGGLWCVPEDADSDGGDGELDADPGEELSADDLSAGDTAVINGDESEVLEVGETDQGTFVAFEKDGEEFVIFEDLLDIEAPGGDDAGEGEDDGVATDEGESAGGVSVGDTFEFDDAPGGEVVAIDRDTRTVVYEDAETGEERLTTLEGVEGTEDEGREESELESSVGEAFDGNTSVNFENMTDEQADSVASAIQDVADAVGVDAFVTEVTTEKPEDKENIASTSAFYSTRESKLFINPDLYSDERVEADFESGFSATETKEGTVYHEMAHVKHKNDLLSEDRLSSVENDQFSEDEESLIEDEVGGYASSEPLEMVAEVFASNMERGETYSDEVMELYNDYGGPELPNP